VGGDIVLQLIQRGESPESIRIVDFVPLNRRDMVGTAAGCDFVKADISSRSSVDAAFSKPWPESVANKPLTVFHTAAIVRPQERSLLFYHRLSAINRDGAVNVLEAARAAGADIFIATSSASVSIVPTKFWIWPWQSSPQHYFQIANEKDFDAPLRPHSQFFSNCMLSPFLLPQSQDQPTDTHLQMPSPKPKPSAPSAAPTPPTSARAPSGPATPSTAKRQTPSSAPCSPGATT
jgi:hypothetical protein